MTVFEPSVFEPVADIAILMQSIWVTQKKIRTPQEKKALSLKKDRRQAYFAGGQKGARKAIPLRKALENRRNRHRNDQAVTIAVGVDESALDLAESSARNDVYRAGGWRKSADQTLGEAISLQKKKREKRIGRKDRAQADSI